MPRDRGPRNLVARRESQAKRAETAAQRDYASMMELDLGGARATSYRAIDDGRPVSAGALLMRPVALFLISCLMLAVVSGIWAWRMGVFEALMPVKSAPAAEPSKTRWMAGGGRRTAAPAASAQDGDPTDAPLPGEDEAEE